MSTLFIVNDETYEGETVVLSRLYSPIPNREYEKIVVITELSGEEEAVLYRVAEGRGISKDKIIRMDLCKP